ncbi:FtsW/RodA/SpoVE family cell cycle protein [Sporolituus thermophilus]|uniref:Cell elongation-specific peptidoglycan biosynthesis regulator RodA n=1 Tax=Sporolituus thermophilus DSM 23256 TaxID=1123285 RepID=A0A1G7KTI8_9FIRM|nr:FtsW/RodA/SpoVE family cell cycle protein [Sporolituus thermophilus]SDF40384.1 cell elongation-specific peptidoglycan biosynthesis regulator RodA [Sporolituus thermophilus DSM 23256]
MQRLDSVRRCERGLLLIASLILLNGIAAVQMAGGNINPSYLVVAIALCLAWFIVHSLVRRNKSSKGDPLLLPIIAVLVAIGLTIILRLKPQLFLLQTLWVAVGLIAFLGVCNLGRRLEEIAVYKYSIGMIGIVLLLATILFGVEVGGNKNWIVLGPVRFQPSEFAKLFIILFLASYLNERREVLAFATRHFGPLDVPQMRFIGPLVLVWGFAMLMLVFQRDLGSALLYFATTLIMVYLASGRISYIIIGVILFLTGAVACYYIFPHVQTRVDIWLNPWADPTGRAYQIVQSLFAFGAGGILGSGLTYGFPDFIPEVHTDFVFAAIAEEMGFVGVAAVLTTYQILIYRAFRIALKAISPLLTLVAGGLAVFLALQIFLIIGGVVKFVPLTGITLPFISYGGSSVVSNFMLVGLLFAVSEMRAVDA